MSNTTEMRAAWKPACADHRGTMRPAYEALDRVLRKWQYAPEQHHTGSYNCRPITGGTDYSLHAFKDGDRFTFWNGTTVTMGVAIDLNWLRNKYGYKLVTDMPRGMVEEICAIRTGNGKQVWGWGGYWTSVKDAMHYEFRITPADLRTGVRGAAQPPGAPGPAPVPPSGAPGVCPEGHPLLELREPFMRGPAVNHAQHFLIKSGAPLRGDGVFGPGTRQAVINHQTWIRDNRDPGLNPDGKVGPKTWQAFHTLADGLRV